MLEQMLVIPSLILIYYFNILCFKKTSHSMYTINLIVGTLSFLFLSKYYDYYDSQINSTVISIVFFYLSHQMLGSLIRCFGGIPGRYVNISMPEVDNKSFTIYTVSQAHYEDKQKEEAKLKQKQVKEKERDFFLLQSLYGQPNLHDLCDKKEEEKKSKADSA